MCPPPLIRDHHISQFALAAIQFYICSPDIIIRTPFHSHKCSGLNDKLYGHSIHKSRRKVQAPYLHIHTWSRLLYAHKSLAITQNPVSNFFHHVKWNPLNLYSPWFFTIKPNYPQSKLSLFHLYESNTCNFYGTSSGIGLNFANICNY